MKILPVSDPSFKNYGQVMTGYDLKELLETLDKVTPCPDGVEYVPEQPELQALAHKTDAISDQLAPGDFQANICLNYGGRDEILRAVRAFAAECAAGEKRPEELDDALFSTYMDSRGIPDPELIIRPSGELRLSNFLLWELAYSEIYVTDVLWPDFGPKDLDKAIAEYHRRNRRFGGA